MLFRARAQAADSIEPDNECVCEFRSVFLVVAIRGVVEVVVRSMLLSPVAIQSTACRRLLSKEFRLKGADRPCALLPSHLIRLALVQVNAGLGALVCYDRTREGNVWDQLESRKWS